MSSHKILNLATADTKRQDQLSRKLGISGVLSQILINRNITTPCQAEEFLNVSTKNLLDPLSFPDMPKALSLVRKAAQDKQRVMVFGDYDVDGITGLALIEETLAGMGIEVSHYLPHRIREGYGLTKNILHTAKQNNIKLLITVDCGISNHAQIEELRRNNIEVIITDHHEPSISALPAASCVINPKVPSCKYGYRDLAGVGVAYKFCCAIKNSMLLDELDMVSLGTIADSVPLTGENRIIARVGLEKLARTRRVGLVALMEEAGIKRNKFNPTYVSFILAPRLNASGRMDTAETSLKLLMSNSPEEAAEFAKVLGGHNRQRQKIEGRIMGEAQDLISREVNFKEHRIIVVAKEDWHQGVLGIVAAKLADKFYRPAIVISLQEDLCKGSARSIKNFHLFQALGECREFLDAFGGHAHAAGLVIAKDNIEGFRQNINRLAHQRLSLKDLLPSLDIDLEVSLGDLNAKIISELEALEPFGVGNPEPLFYTRNLKLKGQPQSLSRDTLKFWATDGEATFQIIGFGMGSFRDSLMNAACFDLVYTPKMDDWLQEPTVLLEAKDIFFR
ncbi:MAG: single-stranded-DNA-specific exonuclease RecJ [Candidatus Omnitrophica bacterium]|nr:single-stranded-DNA-specific exonuclease RecJ [Candidatus Omnitrophota bacterium]